MNTDRGHAADLVIALIFADLFSIVMPALLSRWQAAREAEQARYDREFWALVDHDA